MNSLSAAHLDTVSETTPKAAHALPAWVYNHAELTRLEIERVLKPSWQIVCHVNSIPKPGDYETFDLGPESVLVLRDRDGSISGFHNVCRHRGARLLDGSGNCPATITCPYHGWSYRHDGSLIGVPMRDSFPGLDRAAHGLRPVRVDTALGFVFVCLAGDPAAGRQDLGQTRGGIGRLSPRRNGAAGADFHGRVERRLEDRDGQLPGVVSRADRPSGTVPHVHAGLRRSRPRCPASRAA